MAVQQQGPEIPVLRGRHPDHRKPTLLQQLQQQRRIAAIVFLLARLPHCHDLVQLPVAA